MSSPLEHFITTTKLHTNIFVNKVQSRELWGRGVCIGCLGSPPPLEHFVTTTNYIQTFSYTKYIVGTLVLSSVAYLPKLVSGSPYCKESWAGQDLITDEIVC